jgi:S-formylglutathione hydrolase FrmB
MANIQCGFYAPSLKKNVKALVYIPTPSADDILLGSERHYYAQGRTYQTLYLLHGMYGDCTDWQNYSSVKRYAQEHCLALVMPSGENSFYQALPNGEDYCTYIGKELPEYMNSLFPLSPRREDTFIAGLSMGGYGTFLTALRYPERYAAAAALSGAFDYRNPVLASIPHMQKFPASYKKMIFPLNEKVPEEWDLTALLKKQAAAGAVLPRLYSTCGLEDFVLELTLPFMETAQSLGIPVTTENFPGVHDWSYWDQHIQDVIRWLAPKGDLVSQAYPRVTENPWRANFKI